MTELTEWFHFVAREAERMRSPESFKDIRSSCRVNQPIDFEARLKELKSKIDSRNAMYAERDAVIKLLAAILGIDENDFPNFLKT